ncbi:hypothetical protein XO10_08150 [Marinitoga sp. 1135]|uniref:Response regulator of the LytR/AlgR family n=1 Tax=Marinitoga piezophila (strain DSM 14283 / JCM 11233 / KA3) TaxID=443254 RepID=H2J526_MARPK|nr:MULTISPECIES: LytTR family DNA-binding domain-containing protein [Marinitoga]AEX86043.1 response regulator of the LytR/AlgR family [Marinitoga piezophila KA3]APT76465.1 hypothetical protein LN42_08810 [Marinitoga sp. 1137]NUU96226.1 hypothetical protein [Marinitoga sp. 1135]NUU98149.1 hypothetical protein [Marinitoga sp. 1138]
MIKCVIIEDEIHASNRLEKMLGNFEDIQICGKAFDGDEGVELIEKERPELVFLDINLPGKNGFEVLKSISYEPFVIFITAYQEYAIKAFEENAIDYLLKPFDLKRLKSSIERIYERKPRIKKEKIVEIDEFINKKANYQKIFTVKDNDEILVIPEKDIVYFKAEEKYVFLCTKNKEYYYNRTLKQLESEIDPEVFIRIHKSYIVSINYIKKFKRLFIREYIVELNDLKNTELKIGRSYLHELKEKFGF